jgi:(1->4)-alpha-D-glucan 1-alpha-D-glucosylmutase
VEDPELFAASHELLLRLVEEGVVTGIRLDHIDGLFDPADYFLKLKKHCGPGKRVYVVVEKILSEGEQLSPGWAIHGTTGYEFLNSLNGTFVDSGSFREFTKLYARFTGRKRAFRDVVYSSKKLIITTSMASELKVLAAELNRISESNRHFRDFTLDSLQAALEEVVACFPVYRTYFSPKGADGFDRRSVDLAVSDALLRNPAMEPSAFEFIREMLLPERSPGLPEEEYLRRVRFAMKFQQYTGPVQAKGVEDTAFYRYAPLLSLNEVGALPGQFGCDPAVFHQANQARLERWPLSMIASTTHDTKRGEDSRARLNALSELPHEWREGISQWARINSSARTLTSGEPVPDRSDEYFYYQALIGAWPAACTSPDREFVDRIRSYMSKATKESKLHTSWINPAEAYDRAVDTFVEKTLAGTRSVPFLRAFLPFQQRVARLGMVNSLAQLVLKIASPGVPDFYQGSSLWDLSLVDPDNRRPVDFRVRTHMLDAILPLLLDDCPAETVVAGVREMLTNWEDGRIKQYVTAAGLQLRKRHERLFVEGSYVPLTASGVRKDHVVALARVWNRDLVIAIAPRLPAGLARGGRWLPVGVEAWGDTELKIPEEWAPFPFLNVMTHKTLRPGTDAGSAIPLADALNSCPVALLVAQGAEPLQ